MPAGGRFVTLTAVMAIRSQHAARIYNGDKLFEFRRQRPRFTVGMKVFVYEPKPIQSITGYFRVASVSAVDDRLGELETDPIARATVDAYLCGARRPTAIEIEQATRLNTPVLLSSFGVRVAPQSYVYLQAR